MGEPRAPLGIELLGQLYLNPTHWGENAEFCKEVEVGQVKGTDSGIARKEMVTKGLAGGGN